MKIRNTVALIIFLAWTIKPAFGFESTSELIEESAFSLAQVGFAAIVAIVLCVLLHYESLNFMEKFLRRSKYKTRRRILTLIFAVIFVHIVEISIFGGFYYWLTNTGDHGALVANRPLQLLDEVYFSAVTYTTLGLGDIVPTGAIRMLVAAEALAGFVLITWSASFTFLEMERSWKG